MEISADARELKKKLKLRQRYEKLVAKLDGLKAKGASKIRITAAKEAVRAFKSANAVPTSSVAVLQKKLDSAGEKTTVKVPVKRKEKDLGYDRAEMDAAVKFFISNGQLPPKGTPPMVIQAWKDQLKHPKQYERGADRMKMLKLSLRSAKAMLKIDTKEGSRTKIAHWNKEIKKIEDMIAAENAKSKTKVDTKGTGPINVKQDSPKPAPVRAPKIPKKPTVEVRRVKVEKQKPVKPGAIFPLQQSAEFLLNWSKGKPISHFGGDSSFYKCGKWMTMIGPGGAEPAKKEVAALIAAGYATGSPTYFTMVKPIKK
jgi:hypothetical protein